MHLYLLSTRAQYMLGESCIARTWPINIPNSRLSSNESRRPHLQDGHESKESHGNCTCSLELISSVGG